MFFLLTIGGIPIELKITWGNLLYRISNQSLISQISEFCSNKLWLVLFSCSIKPFIVHWCPVSVGFMIHERFDHESWSLNENSQGFHVRSVESCHVYNNVSTLPVKMLACSRLKTPITNHCLREGKHDPLPPSTSQTLNRSILDHIWFSSVDKGDFSEIAEWSPFKTFSQFN